MLRTSSLKKESLQTPKSQDFQNLVRMYTLNPSSMDFILASNKIMGNLRVVILKLPIMILKNLQANREKLPNNFLINCRPMTSSYM